MLPLIFILFSVVYCAYVGKNYSDVAGDYDKDGLKDEQVYTVVIKNQWKEEGGCC